MKKFSAAGASKKYPQARPNIKRRTDQIKTILNSD